MSGLFHSAPLGRRADDSATVCTSIASHAASGAIGNETFLFDGETIRLSVAGRYTVGSWQLGIRVPVVKHSGGMLDTLIEGWHDFFGLPNGIRDDLADDQLALRLQRGGVAALQLERSRTGLGDVTLYANRQLLSADRQLWDLEFFTRLPSGQADRQTGTGAAAAGLTLLGYAHTLGGNEKLNAEGFAQVAYSQGADFPGLSQRRTQWQVFGRLRYQWTDNWSGAVGLGISSSPYRSQLRPLESSAVALEASVTRRFKRYELSVGFAEDLRVSTHPDVTFRLQWQQR